MAMARQYQLHNAGLVTVQKPLNERRNPTTAAHLRAFAHYWYISLALQVKPAQAAQHRARPCFKRSAQGQLSHHHHCLRDLAEPKALPVLGG